LGILFYNIFLWLYKAGVRIAALANAKASLWIAGRKKNIAPTGFYKTVWMHCASLGEFEQGRPVIEAIKKKYPNYKIVLTFFSPSGYEIRKNYPGADKIYYLPMDGYLNANKFIDNINPSLVIWVKYEYWYYYLTALNKRNIPVLLVSGIFRESQPFFKWYAGIWKTMLHSFAHLFVQTKHSKILLQRLGINENITVSGDTRFDRVTNIAEAFEHLPNQFTAFCKNSKVLVAGSTWDDDEAELIHYAKAHPQIKFIIAPHEVDEENIKDIQQEFTGAILYSDLIKDDFILTDEMHVLIIDNIGMLAKLYYYADITYVGGGFNDSGIHNILEAAVYGKPVIFGPEYERSEEAKQLLDCNGAFTISNALELEAILDKLFNNENYLKDCGKAARDYVFTHRGATELIMNYIQEKRLLTN
jgi:3-deoxy-D-manno-octulosonic-acid transferase